MTPARPGWVKVTVGRVESGSTDRNAIVRTWPGLTVVADGEALKAATVTAWPRVTLPSEVVAVSWAT